MIKQFQLASMLLMTMGSGYTTAHSIIHPAAEDVRVTQQSTTCTGIIKDNTGEPIIGASVIVKGTSNGTITDINGDFSLTNVKKGDIVQVSFVGFLTQEFTWNGRTVDITLKDDTQILDEVVVVGFGTQKKVNLTGAVGTANSKQLESRPVQNAVQEAVSK